MFSKGLPFILLIITALLTLSSLSCITSGPEAAAISQAAQPAPEAMETPAADIASGSAEQAAADEDAESPEEEGTDVPQLTVMFAGLASAEVPFPEEVPYLSRKTAVPLPPLRKAALKPAPKAPALPEPAAGAGPEETALSAAEELTEDPPEAAESFLSVVFEEKPAAESRSETVSALPEPEPAPAPSPEPFPAKAEILPVQPESKASLSAEKVITASAREVLTVELDGEGWLLEQIRAAGGSETDDIRFNGREYRSGKTVFYFYPYKPEIFVLSFRLVDYSKGTSQEQSVRAVVASPDTEASSDDGEQEDEAPIFAEDSSAASGPAEDVDEPSSPPEAPEISEIPENAEGLILYTDDLMAEGKCREAVGLIEERLEKISWTERDKLYFRLAELYQNCAGVRDERRSAEYYRQIVDYYPVSNYWQISRERINYLERNFIYIR